MFLSSASDGRGDSQPGTWEGQRIIAETLSRDVGGPEDPSGDSQRDVGGPEDPSRDSQPDVTWEGQRILGDLQLSSRFHYSAVFS